MKPHSLLKNCWHEGNAFLSSLKLLITGNSSERGAVKGRLFSPKFLINEVFIKRLKELDIQVSESEGFKCIKIKNNLYHWPVQGNLDSLHTVLAEAFFSEHPHYYDSFPTIIKKNDKVLDIGASEGAFSIMALQKGAYVVAVEPSKIMIKAMQLSINPALMKNIDFACCVLGKENGSVGFEESVYFPEASKICEVNEANDYRDCFTLDSFIEKYFPDGIDYIKCDAEGADFDILRSGKKYLAKYKPKIAIASYHSQFDFRNIQNLLEDIGYQVVGQGLSYSPVIHKCYPTLLKAY